MGRISGTEGNVTFASGYDSLANNWTIDIAAQVYDVTAFSDNFDRKVGGRKSWSGTYSGVWDSASTTDNALGGSAAAATFTFKSTAGKLTGNIIIANINYSVGIDGANQINFTFEGDGTPVLTEA